MIEIGLVGCGAWGKNILRDLLKLGCKVYVADIDSSARERAQAAGASGTYPECGKLPLCDGYVVAVPIPELSKICAQLLSRKRPIFSEKTLLQSMDDFIALEKLGGMDYVFCMHKWRYHPGIEELRSIAQSKRIGDIQEIVTTRYGWVKDFHGGDVFWTLAVHDLTIIKHILGYIPPKVRAINVICNSEELPVSLTAMLGDRPSAVISTSGQHSTKRSGVSIHGEKGSAELFNAYDDHIIIKTTEGESKIPIDTTFPLYLELKEFIGYLDDGPKPRCGLKEAKEVTEAILSLKKAFEIEM